MNIVEGTILICGCCGISFDTWKDYQNQGQDKDFGICMECQKDAEKRAEEFFEENYVKLLNVLKPDTREKIEAKVEVNPDLKILYVEKAMNNGWLKWEIGG